MTASPSVGTGVEPALSGLVRVRCVYQIRLSAALTIVSWQ